MDVAINYWTVLAAAVVGMILGMLWYGPLFGKVWRRLSGLSEADMRAMPLSPMQAMGLGFIFTLLTPFVLAWLAGSLNLVTGADALRLAFWVWLGFYVPTTAGSFLWEGKSPKLFLLGITYYLIMLSAMSWIVVRWM